MILEIFILSSNGDCILTRRYKNSSCKENSREPFWKRLNEIDPSECPPYFVLNGCLYVYLLRQGVYFGAIAPTDTTPALVIDVLTRFHQLVKDFCGSASEASIRSNVILIIEVLNEFIGGGYVQLSATSKLKSYVQSTPVTPRQMETPVPSLFGVEYRVAAPNAAERSVIQSRTEQENRKNEVFVDVIERLTVTLSVEGHLERCELHGEVKMRSFLRGSSQLKVKLNEDLNIGLQESSNEGDSLKGYGRAINLSRCTFHESAKLDKSNTLSVFPPEGQFVVMSYYMAGDLPNSLPFRVKSYVKEIDTSSRDIEVNLCLHCEVPANSRAINVTLRIPVPSSTTSINQQLSGAARGHKAQLLLTSHKTIEWKLQELHGKAEESAQFRLIGARFGDGYRQVLGPASVDFEVSGYVCSNLQIRGLQVFDRDTSFTPMKWIHENSSCKENSREPFWKRLNEIDPSECPPYFVLNGCLYVYLLRQGVYFGAIAPTDTTPALVIDALTRFHQLVKDFCGSASEASIRSNVILIIEVLNEFIGGGYVQLSATSKLKSYVQSTPVTPRQMETPVPSLFGVEYRVAAPNAAERSVIQSRTEQENRKNEVFVDVIERLTVTLSVEGHLERCELHGEVKMRSFLRGSSQLKVKLNEDLNIVHQESSNEGDSLKGYGRAINLSRCTFHESAKLDKSNTLSVFPPEGQFVVMSYYMAGDLPNSLPFRVKSYVKEIDTSSRDIEVNLCLHCEVPANSRAINVTLRIPVPSSTTSINQQLSGAARGHKAQLLLTSHKTIEWKLQELHGKAEESAQFRLIGARFGDGYRQVLGPASVDFEVSGYVCSNLQIRGLQVFDRDTSFTPMKWIRYISTSNSYAFKLF